MTKDGAVAENLSTGEVKNISGRPPETDVGSEKHQSSRLQFSQEDLENPAQADAIRRSNAAADKLDAAKENIPKQRKKVRQRMLQFPKKNGILSNGVSIQQWQL